MEEEKKIDKGESNERKFHHHKSHVTDSHIFIDMI